MKLDYETYIVVASVLLIISTPLLNSIGFPWTALDFIGTKLVLFGAAVYLLKFGPLPGLFAALAVLSLYFERNRHVLATKLPGNVSPTYLVQGSPTTPLAPSNTELDYTPHTDVEPVSVEDNKNIEHEDLYEQAPEASGLDEKQVLEEAPSSDSAAGWFESKGLAGSASM